MMTVQDLIDALQKIEDKSLPVCLIDSGQPTLMDVSEFKEGDKYYYVYGIGTVEGPHIILG